MFKAIKLNINLRQIIKSSQTFKLVFPSQTWQVNAKNCKPW